MRGKTVLRHTRRRPFRRIIVPLEPALDHVPAEQTLAAQRHEDQRQIALELRGQAPSQPEVPQRQRERHADEPPEHPMAVLVHEDALELVDAHAAVEQLVLRRVFVAFELGIPFCGIARKMLAGEAPMCHREPRLGETRHPAKHDHAENRRRAAVEPVSHRSRRDSSRGLRRR
eukprot:Amastigsp_a510144_50.p3 type:complete len:173 gc:universal Amastigsp_a510144_50:684-166(-)